LASFRSLRREDIAADGVEADHDRPALRGKTITRDSDVSLLIRNLGAGTERVIHVVRGDKAEELKLKGIN
jgi:hypothetical protein